ncbi:5,10-methylenetetrahydrofolate reductase [hydrothermal vent metagenome]|uniref:5,10-methylenetetrahydrofolate reductase n=1 Tax=hydrothermal vent metagenome TaxID=652676 RepID=A0A3B0T7L1_9ZZZZ
MPSPVAVIACGALAREILAIVKMNGLIHVTLKCLPASLHNHPDRIPDAVARAIDELAATHRKIVVAYGDCGTGGLLDRMLEARGIARIAGPHCYSFFSGNDAFAGRATADMRYFYLTDFLVRQFETLVVCPLGLDRHPDLLPAYFGAYEKLIYLAQIQDKKLDVKAQEAAAFLGLGYEKRNVGYGDLAPFLTALEGAPVPSPRPLPPRSEFRSEIAPPVPLARLYNSGAERTLTVAKPHADKTMPPVAEYTAPPLIASMEATPNQAATTSALEGLLPRGTAVYLTDLGTDNASTTIAAAVRLRHLGYEPVPHIAARRLPGPAALADFLARITGEAGVGDVLVVGGGAARPFGPYAASIDVLETGILDKYGITRIGIAGHPEGSPDISARTVDEALRAKAAFAERTGANMRIVTQFGFDPAAAIHWLEGLTAAGFELPVHLGVAGPAKISTLLKYAAMCGVGPSLGFLRQGAGLLTAIATNYSPDAYVEPVERWHRSSPASGLAGIHVFPFGGLKNSAKWLVDRGSLKFPNGESGGAPLGFQEGGFL